MDSDELLDKIAENISAPKSISGPSGSVELNSITEQINAYKAVQSAKATKNRKNAWGCITSNIERD